MKDNCKDCTLCRLNHKYVLGCNEFADAVSEHTILGNAITRFTGKRPHPPLTRAEIVPIHEHATENMSSTSLSTGDRVLRYITIYAWIPAFGILLAHGIVSDYVVPALGILPMTCSAVAGCVHLAGRARNKRVNIVVDLLIAIFLMGVFIPTQIVLSNDCYGWRCHSSSRGVAMLGAYGSVPLITNIVIHAFFFLREVPLNPFKLNFCPHCQGDLNGHDARQATSRNMSQSSTDSKSYRPVTMRDVEDQEVDAQPISYNHHDNNQPRPSTDDETARLV